MRISLNTVDMNVGTAEEAVMLIQHHAANGMEEIWISADDALYPALAVQVNGKHACVHYFSENDGEMYMSIGDGKEEVTFIAGGIEWNAPADAVITIDEAAECVRRFCKDYKLPGNILWQDGV